MSSSRIVDLITGFFAWLKDVLWAVVAWTLDLLHPIEGALGGALVVAGSLLAYALAARLQKRLNSALSEDPKASVVLWKEDLRLSLPALLFLPIYLLFLIARAAYRLALSLFRKRKDDAPSSAKEPFLAATLGPSYLLAGLVVAGLYLLGRLSEPLLRIQLDLSPGAPAWQYLLLGHRGELALYLPLERYPFCAGLLAFVGWLVLWSWIGRLLRWVYGKELGRNLIREREDPNVLALWRDAFGARFLIRPVSSYCTWAVPLTAVALPLLGWAWFSLGGRVYRVASSEFAVAWILWLSWVIHLRFRGDERRRQEEVQEAAPTAVKAAGWQEVLDELKREHQVGEPLPCEAPRAVESLSISHRDLTSEKILSPLLSEVISDFPGLTFMQYQELRRLAELGHVHTRPPVAPGTLTLGDPSPGDDRANVERQRNRIVLAPSGWGKTTLALLAACNHALVHTRTTLLVVRSEAQAKRLQWLFHHHLDRSTVRWNVRVRRVDDDLPGDLVRGIVPDLVICHLRDLAVKLLQDLDHHGPLLRQVGLVIVDDAESFAGAVEVHAQLAFRRLKRVLRSLQDVAELGEESAPMFLVLGAETMDQTRTWISDLCGIEAEVKLYGYSQREARQREAAAQAAEGQSEAEEKKEDPEANGTPPLGPHHVFYRLVDFRTPYGKPVGLSAILQACEKLAVPWHYRLCGDDRRHLGLSTLLLRDQPEHFRADAEEACVVVLEGHWSEVRREVARLRRAGARFSRHRPPAGGGAPALEGAEPIAYITVIDRDEEMALTQRDPSFSLSRELVRLPRPVLRPPVGRAIEAHLSADLVEGWIELRDLLDVYGNTIIPRLRQLAAEELLLAEERVDVEPKAFSYEKKLYVRALAEAVADEKNDLSPAKAPLPKKVAQVELTSEQTVRLVDRNNMIPIRTVDAASARLSYYPGRILTTAQGRFLVVDVTGDGDILVEPTLLEERSSPRRRVRIRPLTDEEIGTGSVLAGCLRFGPDPVHIGELAVIVALQPIEVESEHLATFRIAPETGQVRQRILYDEDSRQRFAGAALRTEALCLYPNPEIEDPDEASERPVLRFAAARLVAAAMRLVLPSLYRGAREGLAVALQVEADSPSPEHELLPQEGFVLFDLHADGNGTARAIHRDGVELLLRVVRLVLERVLSHERLLVLQDYWGDADELRRKAAGGEKGERRAKDKRQRERELRHEALRWLDSRLRPEGGPPTFAQGEEGYGRDSSEPGEGDPFDIGRCWYSEDGSVANLVWVKHRWRLASGGEAALDMGFDRRVAEESRFFTEDTGILGIYQRFYREHLDDESFRGPDGTHWGAPRRVWTVAEDSEARPESSADPSGDETILHYHALVSAMTAHTWTSLEPLARKLSAECASAERYQLATDLSRFVQGIPYSMPVALRRGLRPPISTLLFRRGDCDSKSVLLAILLKRCGIEAGLFVSFEERHALVAAAVPEPLVVTPQEDATEGEGEAAAGPPREKRHRESETAKRAWEHLRTWREAVQLPQPVQMWAELPDTPKADGTVRLYVPIESTAYSPVGGGRAGDPKKWAFLPLVAIWRRVLLGDRPAPADAAEHGEQR